MMAPHAMKADTLRGLHEALHGEHQDDFLATMGKEISELKSHGTYTIVRKESMPYGANLPPLTWDLKIKQYSDEQM
jgi:hypothetical protein